MQSAALLQTLFVQLLPRRFFLVRGLYFPNIASGMFSRWTLETPSLDGYQILSP